MLYDKNVATFMLQLCYDKNSRQTLANHRLEATEVYKNTRSSHQRCSMTTEVYKNTRSSHQRYSIIKGVLINFAKFTGKQLCHSLFLNKVAGLLNRIPMVAPSDFSLQ